MFCLFCDFKKSRGDAGVSVSLRQDVTEAQVGGQADRASGGWVLAGARDGAAVGKAGDTGRAGDHFCQRLRRDRLGCPGRRPVRGARPTARLAINAAGSARAGRWTRESDSESEPRRRQPGRQRDSRRRGAGPERGWERGARGGGWRAPVREQSDLWCTRALSRRAAAGAGG